MLIFLYGQDTYRSREELRKIILEQKKASLNWFNFVCIDAREKEAETFEQIRQTANTVSMFNEKKLIVVENISFTEPESLKNILNFLKDSKIEKDDSIVIIFWDGDIDDKNELIEYLKKNAKCERLDLLKNIQLKNWIKNYVVENNGTIESQATDMLIERVGNDLWRMSNELNKLLSYDKRIKTADIELLIKPEIDMNVFDIIDAIGLKNKNKALKLMREYFEKREDEIRLLGMFVYQFRNLIKVKSAPNENPGLHLFVLQKTREQTKNFSFEELKKIYHQLLTTDFNIKFGKINPIAALELLVAGL